jgi:hypothetical protein
LIDLDDLWDDNEEFEVAGRRLRVLARSARFMHACYHAALGDWPPRLSSLRDVAQMLLVTGQDHVALRHLSSRWRADSVLAAAVRDTWSLLGIGQNVATSVWAQGYTSNIQDEARLAVHRHGNKNSTAQAWSALSAISSLKEKAAFVRALVFPEAQYLNGRHASAIARLRHGVLEARRGRGAQS